MGRAALLGAISGAAVATIFAGATWITALLGAATGALVATRAPQQPAGFSVWSLSLLAFFAPVFTLAVAPGADMAMHTALARGLVHGGLSPAWPGVSVPLYPRGFSALVALLSPLGYARASLLAAGLSYLVFWIGLTAVLQRMHTPGARTVAAVAVLLCRTPQIFFDWGGNPTALALGLALSGACEESPISALYLAGAVCTHPMAAVAGALSLLCTKLRWRSLIAPLAPLALFIGAFALFGPHLSSGERQWIRDYALHNERAGLGVLGDAANVVTALAAAWLLWKRQYRPVLWSAAAVAGLFALFAVLPYAGLYPARFAPLLIVAVAPLWARAGASRIPLFAPILLLVAMPFHLRWYQQATPIATFGDLKVMPCVAATRGVIDGAYGDATQWIPALTGRPITRPHQHVSLFDETGVALAKLPKPSWRFVGEELRYPPAIDPPPRTPPSCDGTLYPLR